MQFINEVNQVCSLWWGVTRAGYSNVDTQIKTAKNNIHFDKMFANFGLWLPYCFLLTTKQVLVHFYLAHTHFIDGSCKITMKSWHTFYNCWVLDSQIYSRQGIRGFLLKSPIVRSGPNIITVRNTSMSTLSCNAFTLQLTWNGSIPTYVYHIQQSWNLDKLGISSHRVWSCLWRAYQIDGTNHEMPCLYASTTEYQLFYRVFLRFLLNRRTQDDA